MATIGNVLNVFEMKNILKISISAAMGCLLALNVQAGNPDRVGEAGGTQLLINPWAGSSGWGGANMAGVRGVEAMSFNVGGIMNSRNNTNFMFSRTNWLGGVGVGINAFGLTQKLGADKEHALGLSITSFDFGDIKLTRVDQPEESGATFNIQMMNIAFGYSHKFSDNISAGLLMRTLTEGVSDARASGLGLDAGVQYVAGTNDRVKFGVALRNVGPKMRFSGNGLAARGTLEGSENMITIEKRSADFEMPSILNIAGSYDLFTDSTTSNTFTLAGSYTSNAFAKDQFGVGLEYSYRNFAKLHSGFVYEKGMFNKDERTSVTSGLSFGASLDLPFGKEKDRRVGLDYSYRITNPFTGTHSFGLHLGI
ncbi:MAG: PorV/PorQ family protein [Sphingobacteriales bacterium]|nr:MAG: PorV/PorQ family protein [Sphingobacteriales bacterium]